MKNGLRLPIPVPRAKGQWRLREDWASAEDVDLGLWAGVGKMNFRSHWPGLMRLLRLWQHILHI